MNVAVRLWAKLSLLLCEKLGRNIMFVSESGCHSRRRLAFTLVECVTLCEDVLLKVLVVLVRKVSLLPCVSLVDFEPL